MPHTRRCLAALFAASAAVALHGAQVPSSATVIDDPDAYTVYASLIAGEARMREGKPRRLIVQRETATNDNCTLSGAPLEAEWKAVIDDFKLQNAHVRFVAPDRDLRVPYSVVPRKEILSFFTKSEDGWPEFYRRYGDSGGYIAVSAVGFDGAKTRALVYVAHYCGSLCGGGAYHFLQKAAGAWRPVDVPGISTCMWIS